MKIFRDKASRWYSHAKINLHELDLYSAAEASKILGKADNYIRQLYAKYPNKFSRGSIRKIGREYIVAKEAIETLSDTSKT